MPINNLIFFLQKYKDTGILDKDNNSTLLPKTINVDFNNTSLKNYYAEVKNNPIIAMLRDMFFNSFESNLTLNTLIDGDAALNIKK